MPFCGLRALSCRPETGGFQVSCFGLSVRYVEHPQSNEFDISPAQRLFREKIKKLFHMVSLAGGGILYRDSLTGGGFSVVCRFLLNKGWEVS